jgi:hypothetical protein
MEVNNMKKVLSVLLSATLFLGLGTSAVAEVKSKETLKAYDLIEETNKEIAKEIKRGVVEAKKLQAEYLSDLQKLEKGKDKNELTSKLSTEAFSDVKIGEIQSYLNKLGKKNSSEKKDKEILITNEDLEIVSELLDFKDVYFVNDQLSVFTEIANQVNLNPYQELTIKYYEELGDIVSEVSNNTLGMSKATVDEVADLGVKAQCFWVQVQFGDLEVWIDPIRVVGEN